jgi:hypothetical protein
VHNKVDARAVTAPAYYTTTYHVRHEHVNYIHTTAQPLAPLAHAVRHFLKDRRARGAVWVSVIAHVHVLRGRSYVAICFSPGLLPDLALVPPPAPSNPNLTAVANATIAAIGAANAVVPGFRYF